ncbi:transposase [Leisingera sp. M658]|uniref:transposase n=1 Tax=Leisingera sp. M658 TaxID=2867015 RepID=UPI0021A3F621|nr:transposase [Leisingera sp. M658]UWQ77372.1 transposase [Leisingera sp. M658]
MTARREKFRVGHVLFEVDGGPGTFGLFAAEADEPKHRRPLFTGFVERGMGDQLRRLADRFDELEAGQE